MRQSGKILIGGVVTVALLWWVLRDVDFGEVWAQVSRGNFLLLGSAVGLTTFGFVVRAMRWAVFLEPVHAGTTLRSRFTAVAIHFMANNVLWLRVGEFARAWVFSRIEPVRASAAFGTVVVERFMDAVVLLILLIVPVLTPGFPAPEALTEGAGGLVLRAASVAVLAILGGLLAMALFPRRFVGLAKAVAPVLPRTLREPALYALDSFLDSLATLRDPRLLALGFVWTLGFWLLQAASFWLGMLAFGIDTGYVSAVFTSSVIAYVVAIPSSPGFLGPFQGGAYFALSEVYGVSDAQSLAFAFGFHFGAWIPITAIGLYYVGKLGLSLGEVGASEERLEHPEAFPSEER